MKATAYVLAGIVGILGLASLMSVSHGHTIRRLTVSIVCFGISTVLVMLARKPVQHTHVHQMELDVTGDVHLEQITCKQCGAELSSKSVDVAAGAVYVKCEYCGAQYQIEEAPKW
jgi:RNase P subunit RPR2